MTIKNALFIIPLLGLLLNACGNTDNKNKDSEMPEQGSGKLPVDIIIAQPKLLNQEDAVIGTLVPNSEVTITSEIPLKVTKVTFKDGSNVSKGTILYMLDDSEVKARLKQVRAELEMAKLTKNRLGNLLKTEAVNQQEYDEAVTRVNSLEAQEDLFKSQLAKTLIRAPFSGKVGITKVYEGAYVSPGMDLVTLQDQNTLKLSFSIPEKYLPYVRIGNKIRFTDEISGQEHEATISATEPGLDEKGRSLKVQATTANPKGLFRAGSSARVYFPINNEDAKGILVPTEALTPGGKGYNAFIIDNGQAKSVSVTIASRTEKDAIITSGIEAGDSIIVSNILRLGTGTPVQAILPQ